MGPGPVETSEAESQSLASESSSDTGGAPRSAILGEASWMIFRSLSLSLSSRMPKFWMSLTRLIILERMVILR